MVVSVLPAPALLPPLKTPGTPAPMLLLSVLLLLLLSMSPLDEPRLNTCPRLLLAVWVLLSVCDCPAFMLCPRLLPQVADSVLLAPALLLLPAACVWVSDAPCVVAWF